MRLAMPYPAMPIPLDPPGPTRARHGVGPPSWVASLPLPLLLGPAAPGGAAALTPAQAHRACRVLAAALRHRVPAAWIASDSLLFDLTLAALLQRFATATEASFAAPGRRPREVLDAWVAELVGWGIPRRIWFGQGGEGG